MLSTQRAFTLEIDDVETAVAEILEQLDLDKLQTNSIGLISCLPDFLETGVVEELQDALPFDLVGQTSLASAATNSSDLAQLSILVLSGDDVSFSLSLSEPITGTDPEPLKQAYKKASAAKAEKPVFALAYAPLLTTVSGDFLVNATNEVCDGVPFFGSFTVDDTMDYHNSRVIYKGKGYTNQLAYVLFYGDVQPRFYIAGITHGKVFDKTGVVTSSKGNQLISINDAPVSEFLTSLGISKNEEGEFIGINSFPYIVDYNDGTDPVIRVMFAITPEGSAVCGGDIPEGATLAVSFFDKNEILESSSACVERMFEDFKDTPAQALLAFSCVGRYFNLDYEPEAEAQLLHDAFDAQGIPYTFTYSGGEMCPVPATNSTPTLTNRAHNSTFIALAL